MCKKRPIRYKGLTTCPAKQHFAFEKEIDSLEWGQKNRFPGSGGVSKA